MKKLGNILLTFLALASLNVMAQTEPDWSSDPEVRAKQQEKLVYMGDLVSQKDYTKAKPEFDWLYENNPGLTKTIYLKGTKIYEELADAEKDAAKKIQLQDMALKLYDERIKYFQEEENVLNRKGLIAFNYLYPRKTENDKLYDLYSKIFELSGNDTYSSNLYILQKMLCYKKDKGALTDEQVMEMYEKISAVIDLNIANGDKVSVNQQYKDKIDREFASCVKIDCEYIAAKIAPKYKSNPSDLGMAKKLVSMMSSQNCDKNDLFFDAAALIVEKEPSCGGAMTVARNAKREQKY